MTPLLISVDRIKEFSVVNSNVDGKLITPTIIMVQEMFLQEILGTDLYKEICDQVTNANVSVANKLLLDEFIGNYLIHMTIAEGLQNFSIKITNTDIVNQTSQNATGSDDGNVYNFKNQYRSMAEGYAKKLFLYLCSKSLTYPLYNNGNQEAWKIKPKRFEYTSQIYTGQRRFDPRDRFKRTWEKYDR
jgi:hypothetical protein